MQMPNEDSRKRQRREQEQKQQSKNSRNLQSQDDINSSKNRLLVTEDGSRAQCELVGLNPFSSTLKVLSYENALAMQLAIRHLNEGNGSLVSELTGLPNSCPITFSASFADTRQNQNYAFSVVDDMTLPRGIENNKTDAVLPCAFVGAIDSAVSKTTALVTGLRDFPQISPGSSASSLNSPDDFPLFGRTIPDDSFAAEIFVRFLHDEIGIRHFFVIFEPHPYTESILNSLRDAIRNLGWAPQQENDESGFMYMEEKIIPSKSPVILTEAIEALRASEFRFVVSLTREQGTTDALMEIAYEQGMAGNPISSYHWWFFGETLQGALNNPRFSKDSNLVKAYDGVGSIGRTDEKGVKHENFLQQSSELKRELYIEYDNNGDSQKWLFAPEAPFLNEDEWFLEGSDFSFDTASFTYDATVLLGLSACHSVSGTSLSGAEDTRPSLFLAGKDYFEIIKRTNFTGLTGEILLDRQTGTRDGDSIKYNINNWLLSDSDDNDSNENTTNTAMFRSIDTHEYAPGGDDNWEELKPYFFNGGKSKTSLGSNPGLAPVNVTYNEVDMWLIVLSALCCTTIVMMAIGCSIWVCRKKDSPVVRASQPLFLLMLCLGIGLMGLAIIPASLEHRRGVQELAVCSSYIALLVVGFGITFSTILAKTYRINRIMDSAKNFRRIKLSVRDTIYPVAINLVFNIIMLTLMMIFGPGKQVLEPTDNGIDKFGRIIELSPQCDNSESAPYFYTMNSVNFVVVCLALFQTWRARHLSTEFAESRYIAYTLLISAIVLLLTIPVVYLVKDTPNADTFIHTFAITIVTGTSLGFLFVPKMRMHYISQKRSPTSIISVSAKLSGSSKSYGEKILTKKPPGQLTLEVKSLKRELARVKKQNATLQERVQELSGGGESKDKDGESVTSTFTNSKEGHTLPGEPLMGGTMPSVMEGDDCGHRSSTDQIVSVTCRDETIATIPNKCDDSKVEMSDSSSESSDDQSNDAVPKVKSSLKSHGSIRKIISSFSAKRRSDRAVGTNDRKQIVGFSSSTTG